MTFHEGVLPGMAHLVAVVVVLVMALGGSPRPVQVACQVDIPRLVEVVVSPDIARVA